MKKMKLSTPSQISEMLNSIEYQIFDNDFYAKYGYFFDHLIHELISPLMEYPDEFTKFINGIALFWNSSEKLHILYESTTCDVLYALYVRLKILTVHLQTLTEHVEIPDGSLVDQFKYLFTDYYVSKVQTSLSDVRDVFPL